MNEHAEKPSLRVVALAVSGVIYALWLIRITDDMFALELYRWGICPRELSRLTGLLLGPLIHGSTVHLFVNTLPLFVLGTAIVYVYPRSARIAIPVMVLGSGIGVWLFGRATYHIGASGLAHGLIFFLFAMGVLRRDRPSMALSMLVFFLYGGMVWSIFPQEPGVSFESHFFGGVIGLALAFVLRHHDPAPPEKKYDWEGRRRGRSRDRRSVAGTVVQLDRCLKQIERQPASSPLP
ncbi:MAG: rhomboid family intramembrane serine protease [Gammaproteobacteria bacterium]